MCQFFWYFCYCCNRYIETFKDSVWCGDVDCSRNQINTEYDFQMCENCIEMGCYKKKQFCDITILPNIIERSKPSSFIL